MVLNNQDLAAGHRVATGDSTAGPSRASTATATPPSAASTTASSAATARSSGESAEKGGGAGDPLRGVGTSRDSADRAEKPLEHLNHVARLDIIELKDARDDLSFVDQSLKLLRRVDIREASFSLDL